MASSGRLQPGEKGVIRLTVDTRGRSGKLMKTASVVSNDPVKRISVLMVSLNVTGPALPQASASLPQPLPDVR